MAGRTHLRRARQGSLRAGRRPGQRGPRPPAHRGLSPRHGVRTLVPRAVRHDSVTPARAASLKRHGIAADGAARADDPRAADLSQSRASARQRPGLAPPRAAASQRWGSPSQQPSFRRQRGHCQVPWRQSIAALQRRQRSTATAFSMPLSVEETPDGASEMETGAHWRAPVGRRLRGARPAER